MNRGMRLVPSIRLIAPARFKLHQLRSSTQSLNSTTPSFKPEAKPTWDIRMLYDGECPLCLREVSMLKARDKDQNKILFVNIASEEYDPDENGGVTYGEAMGKLHGVLPDGRVIVGVEVFRRCYEAVGLGWIYALTKFKPVEIMVTMVYNLWAKVRLPLTGRSTEGIEDKILWNDEFSTCADSESCELPWGDEVEEEEEEQTNISKST